MSTQTLAVVLPILIVAAALLFILLERIFPYDKGQPFFREGFFSDVMLYAIAQSYVLSLVIGAFIDWVDSQTGLSRLRLVGDWPIWAQVTFFLVTHDLYIYWFHRLQHHHKVLWRLHEAHHSAKQVDWIAGARSHSLEILINQTIEFAPIVLLGAAPEVVLIKSAIDSIWGMWIHSNINVKTGALQFIINGPEMHRWHHAKEIKEGGLNYSTKLAIWDWLFGTAYLPKEKPSGYGITDEQYPLSVIEAPWYVRLWCDTKSYIKQHLYAFRPLER